MSTMSDIKKDLKSNSNKKQFFVKWYVDSKEHTEESYNKNKNCKFCDVSYTYAMQNWLFEEDVQNAIKNYIAKKRNIEMINIYNSMLDKAKKGDVRSAEWCAKFQKSDFFEDSENEIDDYLEGINIPALKGGGK